MTGEFGPTPAPCWTCGGSGTIAGTQIEVTQIFDPVPRFVTATEPTPCPTCRGGGRRPDPRLRLLPSVGPTAEGVKRFVPDGFYREGGEPVPCTCGPTCPPDCRGACGCRACHMAFQDFGLE